MKIIVNVKGTSGKTIRKKEYCIIPQMMKMESVENSSNNFSVFSMTIKDFLEIIVKLEVTAFNENIKAVSDTNPDKGYDCLDQATVLRVLSDKEMEVQKESGRIAFGVMYNQKLQDENEAIQNALQCFCDGLVCVFIDGKRFTALDEVIELSEGMEVAFVRLTFLAGRIW